jgi:hypothetical protein
LASRIIHYTINANNTTAADNYAFAGAIAA